MRPIVPDELPSYKRTDEYGFGFRRDPSEASDQGWTEIELDRTVAVFEGDEIVGIGRNYSLDLTLPGGAIIPASAVSWIAVRPTHRRRGILRRMMTYLVEEGAQRGEPASILTASEGGHLPALRLRCREPGARASRSDAVRRVRHAGDRRRASGWSSPRRASRSRPSSSTACGRDATAPSRARPVWWTGEWAPSEWVEARASTSSTSSTVASRGSRSTASTEPGATASVDKTVAVQRSGRGDARRLRRRSGSTSCGIDLTQRVTAWNVHPDIELVVPPARHAPGAHHVVAGLALAPTGRRARPARCAPLRDGGPPGDRRA